MTPGRRNSGRPAISHLGRIGFCAGFAALLAGGLLTAGGASAAPIANPVATFSGLDKITARLTNFDVYINETVQFGSLQITPRVCYTRPAEEAQRTSVFVEVDQVSLSGTSKRIFTGWMFADSPALNAVDDPVYDFWLVDCKQHSSVPPPTETNPIPGPVAATPESTAPPDVTPVGPAPPDNVLEPPTPGAGAAADEPAPTQVENGSIITLMNPKSTAETSPDGQ